MLITQQELSQNQANNTQYLEQARVAAIKIIIAYILQLDHNTDHLQENIVDTNGISERRNADLKIDLDTEIIDRVDFEKSLKTVLSYVDQMDGRHKERDNEQLDESIKSINSNTVKRLDAINVNISQEYLSTPVDRALFDKALCFLRQIKHLKSVADIIGPLDDFEESYLSPVELNARENAIFQQINNLAGAHSHKRLARISNIAGYLYLPTFIGFIISNIFA